MNETWKKTLKQALADKGLSMKAASLAAGKGETFVRDVLERGRAPSIDNFITLANIVGKSPAELFGEGNAPISGEKALLEVLKRVEGLDQRGVELAFAVITNHLAVIRGTKPSQDVARDQSSQPTPHHGSSPSPGRS